MDIFHSPYYRINKWLLLFVGFWPYQHPTIKRLIQSLTVFSVINFVTPQVLYVWKFLNNVDNLLTSLPTASGSLLIAVKMCIFLRKDSEMRRIIDEVCEHWSVYSTEREQEILVKYASTGRTCTLSYGCTIQACDSNVDNMIAVPIVTLIVVTPLSAPIFDVISPLNESRPRNLPHPAEYFLDQDRYFYLLMFSECLAYLMGMIFVLGTDTIFIMIVQHCCGMVTILRDWLENTPIRKVDFNTDSEFAEVGYRDLIHCIRLHLKIKRYIQLMTSIFESFISADIIFGVVMHCTTSVMIVIYMDKPTYLAKFGGVLLTQTIRLFLSNWPGQNLMDHSASIAISAYCGTWYRMSTKARKLLLFLMMDAQKPHMLTIARLYAINLNSFGMVMRTSLSYCTVMASLQSTSAE